MCQTEPESKRYFLKPDTKPYKTSNTLISNPNLLKTNVSIIVHCDQNFFSNFKNNKKVIRNHQPIST